MSDPRNPQAQQMGDESMARNLAHQAQAIWPQEQRLFDRYGLEGPVRILDLGCGTGEITRRLAQRYPHATLLGIDILESNLARARAMDDGAGRISYAQGDAFALQCGDAAFDQWISFPPNSLIKSRCQMTRPVLLSSAWRSNLPPNTNTRPPANTGGVIWLASAWDACRTSSGAVRFSPSSPRCWACWR